MHPEQFSPWPSVLALAAVLALILVVAWVLKRIRVPGVTSDLPMRPVGSLSLGARERVVVVEIADQWHVLGVTAQSITPLAQMPKQALPTTDNGTAGANFMALLAQKLKR